MLPELKCFVYLPLQPSSFLDPKDEELQKREEVCSPRPVPLSVVLSLSLYVLCLASLHVRVLSSVFSSTFPGDS